MSMTLLVASEALTPDLIKTGKIGVNLCALIFACSLTSVFKNDIGWKLAREVGSLPALVTSLYMPITFQKGERQRTLQPHTLRRD